jgi:thiol-disulfide isomerase/thioredoxin
MKSMPLLLVAALLLSGCPEKKKTKAHRQTGTRIAAVKPAVKKGVVNDRSGFCEKTWPGDGPNSKNFSWPPLRPLPGEEKAVVPSLEKTWTWVNLWATWCVPCMDEMDLLGRWTKSLASDGAGMALELLTIDDPKDTEKLKVTIEKGLPGPVRWLENTDDFGPLLDSLGLDRAAAIPIHALVDPNGKLRCVRVGAIHALDFAAVKGIVRGG